jgi:hypothetical protein
LKTIDGLRDRYRNRSLAHSSGAGQEQRRRQGPTRNGTGEQRDEAAVSNDGAEGHLDSLLLGVLARPAFGYAP